MFISNLEDLLVWLEILCHIKDPLPQFSLTYKSFEV